MSSIPFVLLYGATGRTGRDIIQGLIRTGGLRIGTITRSADTPAADQLRKLGVELRILDVGKNTEEELVQKLQGVDIVISVISGESIKAQRPLFKAAKTAGVKRVVPSDFGPCAPSGVMMLHDQELGLGYTWIDVGWWKQLTVPFPPNVDGGVYATICYQYFGDGKQPFAVTDRRIIGDFTGHIIKDERTLNKYVFVYEDVVTQEQVWKIARKEIADSAELDKKQVLVSHDQLQDQLKNAKEALDTDPSSVTNLYGRYINDYYNSLFIRGDNTPARAKELGALDARELYPDLKVQSLRDYTKEFYADPLPEAGEAVRFMDRYN